ncbi:LysR family transcriptional regulator [Actinoplanes awajinensis]|uniref:LysR family transcriptional regulator n=1 Tax=Actinoplanes awajinensis subsp. mycoplanecinus TaxID=135947 RepID=A0A0X3V6Q1_9ACTN|nr:LysR family transcriptional regulator [Actinoplanes awajinensis]KUL40358.1 LysR family transcriptional regulator [Actinoplanes awajinensis subsp. mycoplanecinus]
MTLSPRMPDLAALEILLLVARTGTLSGAGRESGLTQQAVSARLAALEARTGVRLATRTTRGTRLTREGVVVAQWADRLIRLAEEVDTGLATLREDTRTRLRVSASLTIAEHLLPGWLVGCRAAATREGRTPPDVVLTAVNSDQVLERVLAGAADLGFIEGPTVPAGVRSRVVARDELVLVVPPEHDWARRSGGVTVAELAATPLVTREHGSGTRESLAAALRRAGYEPAPAALELSTTAAVRAAVLAGGAPAVVSRLAVEDDLRSGRLRHVPVPGFTLPRELLAVWTGVRTPPAGAVRTLLGHIHSTGGSASGQPPAAR